MKVQKLEKKIMTPNAFDSFKPYGVWEEETEAERADS